MEKLVSLSGERPATLPLEELAGVGLLRGEFIFRSRGEYVSRPEALTELQEYLRAVCTSFDGRPVWYRLCDFWSDEANVLEGSGSSEDEPNPIIGVRGLRRSLRDREALNAELGAVYEVAQEHKNLHLLAPFVQDSDEFAKLVEILEKRRWSNQVGTMVEIPAAVLDAERFVAIGATNLLIGLNDLTCLMLGRERGSSELKLHRAIWWAVEHVRSSVPAGVVWGLGGSITPEVLSCASHRDIPYVTLHYAELPGLLGFDASLLEDLEHVRRVKAKTRAAKRARSQSRQLGRKDG